MSTLVICDLPEDRALDHQAMLNLRGGLTFASRAIPGDPVRTIYPTELIRIAYPGDPVLPVVTNSGFLS
jgi:hypothetical protein